MQSQPSLTVLVEQTKILIYFRKIMRKNVVCLGKPVPAACEGPVRGRPVARQGRHQTIVEEGGSNHGQTLI